MSEKNAKMDRKLKAIEGSANDVDWKKEAKEQAQQIGKMYADRDKKALAAKEHLVSSLEVTVDKYRTANGVMAALQTVRSVAGEHSNMSLDEEIGMAKTIATMMSRTATRMTEKARDLDPEYMDELCDGFYDGEFSQNDTPAQDMVVELMTLQLCQNVGPDAEDVVEFCRTTDEEIEKTRDALRTFCTEHDVNFHEICGDGGDCICLSCAKNCGDETKIIHEGQSAYDVCEDFVNNCEG